MAEITLQDIIQPENLVYEKSKLLTEKPFHYCPGCGHAHVGKARSIFPVTAGHPPAFHALLRSCTHPHPTPPQPTPPCTSVTGGGGRAPAKETRRKGDKSRNPELEGIIPSLQIKTESWFQ